MTPAEEWKLPWEGGCRCGQLRFRITQPPAMASVCHCRGCQRMSASAFSTSLSLAPDGFAVLAGEPVIGGLHGKQAQHHHCDACKSWVYTVSPEMGMVNVRATMLDEADWFEPFIEMQTAEMLPWAKTSAAHSFERFPAVEEFEGLVASYAAEGKGP